MMIIVIMMTAMNLAHEYLDHFFNPLKHDFRVTNVSTSSLYLTVNSHSLRYKDQSINAVQGNALFIVRLVRNTKTHTVREMSSFSILKHADTQPVCVIGVTTV